MNSEIVENNQKQGEFVRNLYSPIGAKAHRYLVTRGFSVSVINKWRFGYASDKVDGRYLVLSNRITIPICDYTGRLVSFAGRVIGSRRGAKYIGMDSTPTFEKFKHVYGLDAALPSIAEIGVAIVVEGYLDVVACHEFAHIPIVVSSMGVAFTEWQALSLARWAKLLIFVFDGDSSGKRAAQKALKVCSDLPVKASSVALPAPYDPYDMAIKLTGNFGRWIMDRVK